MKRKLTPKQSRFIDEYLIDLNATQAAIRAGYSAKTANEQGCQHLAKLNVQQEVSRRVKVLCNRYAITHQAVLTELAAIAFSDLTDIIELTVSGELNVRPSCEWPEPARRALIEISETKYGVKVRNSNKMHALELLGRYLTLWRDDQPQKVVKFTINVGEAAPVVVLSDGNGDR